MADDTRDTRPGSAPGVIKTGADGSVPDDLGGRQAWVRMQDSEEGGGGRFDVLASRVDMWRRKGATVVPGYPIHFGPSGRAATARANLGGTPAGEPTVSDGATDVQTLSGPPPADPTLAKPAAQLGAVEPADERQPDGDQNTGSDAEPTAQPDPTLARPASELGAVEPARLPTDTSTDSTPAPAEGQQTDQADGEPAAADTTTKTRRGGRTR